MRALCLAVLAASAVWADEAADRAGIEAVIATLNTSPSASDIFTADFPNAAELQRLREGTVLVPVARVPTEGTTIQTPSGTLVISREPMGEAIWYPAPNTTAFAPRFITRSITFTAPDTAVVVALYQRQPVVFVLKSDGANWRITSFRTLPEAQTRTR